MNHSGRTKACILMKDNSHFSRSAQHGDLDIYFVTNIGSKFIDIWFAYIIPNSKFHVYILNKQPLPQTRLDKILKGEYYVTICMQLNVSK